MFAQTNLNRHLQKAHYVPHVMSDLFPTTNTLGVIHIGDNKSKNLVMFFIWHLPDSW